MTCFHSRFKHLATFIGVVISCMLTGCAWPIGEYEVMTQTGRTLHFTLDNRRQNDLFTYCDGLVDGDIWGRWKYEDEQKRSVGIYQFVSGWLYELRFTVTREDGTLRATDAHSEEPVEIRKVR